MSILVGCKAVNRVACFSSFSKILFLKVYNLKTKANDYFEAATLKSL